MVVSKGTDVVEACCLNLQDKSRTYTEDGSSMLSETLDATQETTRRHGTGRQYHKHSVCLDLLTHKESVPTKHRDVLIFKVGGT